VSAMKGDRNLSVTSRAFAILDLLRSRTAIALSDVVAETGLPAATAHRYLSELTEIGLLERQESGRYRLGLRVWQLGVASDWDRQVRSAAVPFLDTLAHQTGHAIAFSLLQGDRVICFDRRRGRSDDIILANAGEDVPLLRTSVGKVLLAGDSAANVAALVRRDGGPASFRSRSLTQIDQARVSGYVVADGEALAGQRSMSVAVGTDPRTGGQFGLTVLTPLDYDNIERYLPTLVTVARKLGSALRLPPSQRVAQTRFR
jgi:DNA-binding IclR family transcriptional regulator